MRAYIFKEIRELCIWASMMVVSIGASFYFAFNGNPQNQYVLYSRGFLVAAISFSAAGFAIGLIPALRDYPAGRWAFVSHRPISRSRIFCSKTIVGAAVYILVVSVPSLVAIWWLTTPGHYAMPFDWHMILPVITNVMDGLIWYSAALLLICRRARWIGSRVFPVGIALLATIFSMHVVINFASSMLVCSLVIAILLLPAWGAFVAGGTYPKQPVALRFLQAISIAPGLAIVMAFAVGMVVSVGQRYGIPVTRAQYVVIKNGDICVGHFGQSTSEYSDLKGHPVVLHNQPSDFLDMQYVELNRNVDTLTYDEKLNVDGYSDPTRYCRIIGQSNIEWFYLPSRRTIEGYDGYTRNYVGSIGPNGFVPANQPPQAFDEKFFFGTNWLNRDLSPFVASSRAVYRIDFPNRIIERVFTASPADPIEVLGNDQIPDSSDARTLIFTKSTVHLWIGNQKKFEFPLTHSTRAAYGLEIGSLANGGVVLQFPGDNDESFVETDANGKIVKDTTLPNLNWNGQDPDPQWLDALAAFASPPVLGLSIVLKGEVVRTIAKINWICGGMLAAAITWLIFGRFNSGKGARLFWTIANLFLGIGGVLLLLCLRESPGRIRCPACGRRRLVTLELCEYCGAPFEQPPMKGIEIFEGGEVAAPL